MTYEDFERGAVVVLIAGLVLLTVPALLLNTPDRAEKRVLERARRDRLPRDDVAFAEAVRRHQRETRSTVAGSLLGGLASSPALLVDFGFVGSMGVALGMVAGQGIGRWLTYALNLGRRRVGAPSRRPGDYLSPAEIGMVGAAPVVAVIALVVGLIEVQAQAERRAALLVVIFSATGLTFCVVTVVAQWWLLSQWAETSTATAWVAAERVEYLRDLLATSLSAAVFAVLAGRALTWSTDSLGTPSRPVDLLSSITAIMALGLSLAYSAARTRPAGLRSSKR